MCHFVSGCKVHQSRREHDADWPLTDAQPDVCQEADLPGQLVSREISIQPGGYRGGRFRAKA